MGFVTRFSHTVVALEATENGHSQHVFKTQKINKCDHVICTQTLEVVLCEISYVYSKNIYKFLTITSYI